MRTRDAGVYVEVGQPGQPGHHSVLGQSAPRRRSGRGPLRLLWLAMPGLLALFAVVAAQLSGAPVAAAQGTQPSRASIALRPTHATPVRSSPAADAILKAPPSQVKIWFDEAINPSASRIVVVDPSNHEVDARNSRVDMSGQTEMTIGLQLLRPGAYIVVWRAQSLDDGHVTGGSFLFRIANADGSVPPIPATLPSGNVPGAAGFGSSPQTVDGPTLTQSLGDWLALLFALFWVGGVIWEAWVLPARRAPTSTVALGAHLAERRFQRLAPWALVGALLADGVIALALTVQVAGSWRGAFAGQYWQATLFSGSFGSFWWMRQGTLAVALVLALLTWRGARRAPAADPLVGALDAARADDSADSALASAAEEPIPSWTHAVLETLRQTPRLPLRLARGLLDLSPLRQAEVVLGVLLLFAFAMSGHAAATPPDERAYAVSVDFAHLIFSAIWLGGLLYISVVLIPAARALPERMRALLLARGAPEFGAIAIASAAALALTGSLSANVRLTSLAQFATTAFGRTLFVKIELFLIMVAISAFHAFWLRPRLTRSLATTSPARLAARREVAGVGAQSAGQAIQGSASVAEQPHVDAPYDSLDATQPVVRISVTRASQNGHSPRASATMAAGGVSDEARSLRACMEDWLRREAIVGVGVLLCVALLTLFAGTLAPTQAAAPATNGGAFKQSQVVSGYTITLQVAPATFGQNTFIVTVVDAQGKPVSDASTQLVTQDLDMDMGEQTVQLRPVGASQPGAYSGQGDLTMAGHWSLAASVTPTGAKSALQATYKLVVGS
ncbi:MAG TPA: copper resistance protein CopC [Ktedonobacterales bacterium]|nr:copper resistance protein CopC [Ktedonobacterales bacterium]